MVSALALSVYATLTCVCVRARMQMEDAGHAASANRLLCAQLRSCKRDNRLFSQAHKATPRHMDTLHRPLIVRCTRALQPKGGDRVLGVWDAPRKCSTWLT